MELVVESINDGLSGRRKIAIFRLRGAAASNMDSWIVTAIVELDRDTQAALRITAELVSSGAVSR
jgi:hypothetical protein